MLRTILQHNKSEKGTLSEITVLSNTFHSRQDQTFTKIYKLYNQITIKNSHQQRLPNCVAQSMQWW